MKLALNDIRARLAALESAVYGHSRERWSKRKVAEHDGVNPRTVMRGVGTVYAKPEVENGRLYWWSDTYRLKPAAADTPALKDARDPRLRRKGAQAEV
jgi:hypothetical protein